MLFTFFVRVCTEQVSVALRTDGKLKKKNLLALYLTVKAERKLTVGGGVLCFDRFGPFARKLEIAERSCDLFFVCVGNRCAVLLV